MFFRMLGYAEDVFRNTTDGMVLFAQEFVMTHQFWGTVFFYCGILFTISIVCCSIIIFGAWRNNSAVVLDN